MGRRHARRHLAIVCLVAAVTAGAGAGCSAGGASPATAPGRTNGSASPASGTSSVVPALPARALAAPGCSAAAAAGTNLGSAGTVSLRTSGPPFGVAAAPDGRWAFAVTSGGPGSAGTSAGSVTVLRLSTGKGTTAAPAVTPVRSIPLPRAAGQPVMAPAGAAITSDGKYLLVAEGNGAVVVSVARAEAGGAGAVLGTLAVPGETAGRQAVPLGGAIEVAVSPDGRFAFVTLENEGKAAVFNLAAALASGFGPADYVGAIPLGQAPVGVAVSPDGRWLYATSEAAAASRRLAGPGSAGGCGRGVPGTSPGEQPGTLTVIGLRTAESDPAHSVVATVDAGYQPVRVVTSADGTQVWVTARASDDLLCFSAARLAADPARALAAVVRVGSEPVGLAPARGGTLIVVANSNRFGAAGANSSLTVVSVTAALAGRPAVLGELPAGGFPRDMAVSPGGTLLVSDYASSQLQAVSTAALPASP
jgi:DNA-binding beta-propeller fold protein YncE